MIKSTTTDNSSRIEDLFDDVFGPAGITVDLDNTDDIDDDDNSSRIEDLFDDVFGNEAITIDLDGDHDKMR